MDTFKNITQTFSLYLTLTHAYTKIIAHIISTMQNSGKLKDPGYKRMQKKDLKAEEFTNL